MGRSHCILLFQYLFGEVFCELSLIGCDKFLLIADYVLQRQNILLFLCNLFLMLKGSFKTTAYAYFLCRL
jgi:hypothetical protein